MPRVKEAAQRARRSVDVVVAGELNLDLVLYGLPPKMELERELLASNFSMTLGSSSAILVHNMAKLGCSAAFLGKVGDDAMGEITVSRLREAGVDTTRISVAPEGTSTGVTVLLPHGRDRHILTYIGAMATLTEADVDDAFLLQGRHLHLSSLFLQTGLRPGAAALLRRAREAGLTTSLDTNDDPEDRWEGIDQLLPLVDVLLPNDAEACRMTSSADVEQAMERLAAQVPLVAVKCGANGARLAYGTVRAHVAGTPVVPVDTIGAGDSFNAGFLTAYLRGHDPETCAAAGNLTAALSTLRSGGTEAFRDDELRNSFLREHGFGWMERAG
ncbi:carbohydrate kinase family protein [Terriglobus albidus]|uniref:carbohydrate kinase family protein n=1 Tax=Terriglobus albidus TaxID=1592106 RepID=UPI0021DFDAEE|nr:sugar kinase [Terriglobus albidus]